MKVETKLLLAGGVVAGLYFLPELVRARERGTAFRGLSVVASPVVPGGNVTLSASGEYINPRTQDAVFRFQVLEPTPEGVWATLVDWRGTRYRLEASPTEWKPLPAGISVTVTIPADTLPGNLRAELRVFDEAGNLVGTGVGVVPVEAASLGFRNLRVVVG